MTSLVVHFCSAPLVCFVDALDSDRLSRGLTYGLQVIEGLHRAGVEFRSLSEGFDTSTSTGKL